MADGANHQTLSTEVVTTEIWRKFKEKRSTLARISLFSRYLGVHRCRYKYFFLFMLQSQENEERNKRINRLENHLLICDLYFFLFLCCTCMCQKKRRIHFFWLYSRNLEKSK
ncbi:hypothetical protein E1A91_A09G157200v1 [Gossypium mustelinum]|uniref:Uncharacterized protein n=1 Tax=Gossypium mustelinum TaxID=34275 RepID=A0A5D2XYR6_GOSMU|nr:hypothetical protein E1A91_A09G157200v1 [Gossypium mustelinum]